MKEEKPPANAASQPIDAPKDTRAEPEWIEKVLSLAGRAIPVAPTGPKARNPIPVPEER
jgi:hypothetical protein